MVSTTGDGPLRSLWVTNIPTPYRNHLYKVMAGVFPRRNLEFEVSYMAVSEPDRHWRFGPGDLPYRFRVWPGLHPRVRGVDLHWNPTLVSDLARRTPDILVVGGWSSPTHAACAVLPRHVGLRVLWVESNRESTQRSTAAIRAFKRAIISRYDAYIVPGPRSRELIEDIDPAAARRPFLTLPNVVDEGIWTAGRDRQGAPAVRERLGVDRDTRMWVCPARLEPFKGLHLLLPRLAGVHGIRLIVAGEGSQREELERRAKAEGWPVSFVGQQGQAAMVDLYRAADLFVLPSLSDPSPLSPIEAIAAGLPILVSRRIGNLDDVLDEGANGWSFDPESEATTGLLRRVAGLDRAALAAMGAQSSGRYDERFDSGRCVDRLAVELRAAWEAARPPGGRGRAA